MLRDFPISGTIEPSLPAAEAEAVPIRHAATVMLVRAASGGPDAVEVFAFVRRPSLTFAAGMLVFPGGAVETHDGDDALPWAGPSAATFAGALSADETLARAVVAAAVRETFEECGVLLAGPADGGTANPALDTPLDVPEWEVRRHALIDGSLDLQDMLRDAGLVLRADLVRPWAHWLTPLGERRRFDTRFFVAALPPGQAARDLGGEGEQAAWLAPSEALAGYRAGELPMLPPTVVAMEELAAAPSLEALLATARRPRPVSPWLERDGDEYVLRIDLDGVGGGEPGPVR